MDYFLILGLLGFLSSGFLLLLTVNYIVVNWHAERLKIKTQGWDAADKAKIYTPKNSVNSQALAVLGQTKYPDWFVSFLNQLDKLRQNAGKFFKDWIGYLINLSKPASERKVKQKKFDDAILSKDQRAAMQFQNLADNYIRPEQQHAPKIVTPAPENPFEVVKKPAVPTVIASSPTQETVKTNLASGKKGEGSKTNLGATIGLSAGSASNTGKTKTKAQELFEKLEKRILSKLKETGLDHYEIWLELGDLYAKYNENEKAKEVYALILRHSKGKEKDYARDKLIAIG